MDIEQETKINDSETNTKHEKNRNIETSGEYVIIKAYKQLQVKNDKGGWFKVV